MKSRKSSKPLRNSLETSQNPPTSSNLLDRLAAPVGFVGSVTQNTASTKPPPNPPIDPR